MGTICISELRTEAIINKMEVQAADAAFVSNIRNRARFLLQHDIVGLQVIVDVPRFVHCSELLDHPPPDVKDGGDRKIRIGLKEDL